MDMTGQQSAAWQKSPFCVGGSCVELAAIDGDIALRDSKLAESPVLRFTKDEWEAFATWVRHDSFPIR